MLARQVARVNPEPLTSSTYTLVLLSTYMYGHDDADRILHLKYIMKVGTEAAVKV